MKLKIFNLLVTILALTSCVQDEVKLEGSFDLEGFKFDVVPPTVRLAATTAPYEKNSTTQLRVVTGTDLLDCASFTHFAITETPSRPSDSAYTYTCNQAGSQIVSYNLTNTTEGDRTLYFWGMDKNAGTYSTYSTLDFIYDETAPTGSIGAIPSLLRGGTTQNVAMSSGDNIAFDTYKVEMSTNGVSWTEVGNFTESITSADLDIPVVDSSVAQVRVTYYDKANNTLSLTSSAFTVDSTAPTLNITDLAAYVSGGSTQNITFSTYDLNGMDTWELQYAADGSTFTTIASNPTSPYAWSVPTAETTTGTLRLVGVDNAGNQDQVSSATFTVDATAPSLTLAAIPSPLRGGASQTLNYTITDASPIVSATLEYAADGTNYSALATVTGTTSYSWTIPSQDNPSSRIRLTAVDSAGNSSTVISNAFIVDSTAPAVTLSDVATLLRGGNTEAVNFTATDTNGIASRLLNYSSDNGTSYSNVATVTTSPYTWTIPSLDNNTSKLQLVVTDNAGNVTTVTNATFTIDSTAPTLSLTDPSSLLMGGNTESISFSSNDLNGVASTSLQYAADGTNFTEIVANPTSAYTWTIPTDDTTTAKLRFIVTDNAGNVAQTDSTAFAIDSTAPALSITDLAAVVKGGTTENVTFSATDASGFSSFSLDYAPDGFTYSTVLTTTNSSPFSWTLPTSDTTGSKLRLSATDNAGNTNSVETAGFNIDSTGPLISLDDLAAAIRGGLSTNVTFSASDDNGVDTINLNYAADGSTYSSLAIPTVSPYSWAVPSVDTTGSKLQLVVTDIVGNSTTVENAAFNIDSTPPALNITDLPTPLLGGATQNITFTNSDDNGVASLLLEYSLDGGTSYTTISTTPSSPQSWSIPTADTANAVIRLTGTDTVGNSTTFSSNTFTIDSTPPTVDITDLASVILGGGTTSVIFSASDTATGIANLELLYAANGTTFSPLSNPATSPYSWSVPSVDTTGSKLKVIATDGAGNTAEHITVGFNIDSTPPTVTLSDLATVIRGGMATNVNFTTSDANGVDTINLNYAADGTTFSALATPGTSPYSWAVPSTDTTGSKLQLVVSDVVGNTTTVSNAGFNIDSTPPALSITALPSPLKGGNSQNITFTNSDTNGVASLLLEYSPDGINYTTISASPTSPQSWTIPATDTINADIRLTGTDIVGNSTSVTSNTFIIDSTPPTVDITDLAASILGGGTTNVTFSASDSTGITNYELQYAANGTTFSTLAASTTSPYSWSVPTVDTTGSTLRVIATDGAGNTASHTTVGFNIDSTPPTLNLNNMAAIIRGGISNNVTHTKSDTNGVASSELLYAADGVNFVSVTSNPALTYGWATPAVDLTTAKLRMTATDNAGNVQTVTNNVFEIDSTAPTGSISTPASPIRGGSTTTITFSTADSAGIGSISLQYAADGTNFSTVLSTTNSGSYSWTVPTTNTTGSRVRLVTTDTVGNQAIYNSGAFNIDSTPSPAPTLSLTSPVYTKVTGNTFTAGNCTDVSAILINEGTQPARGDAAWQTCTTTANAITYTMPAVEGPHTLKAWSKDSVGNVSATSTNFTVYYDVTAPTLAVSNPGLMRGGASYTLNWTMTETYINSTKSFTVQYWNGSAWNAVGTVAATTGPHTNQGYSTSWTAANLNRTDVKIRVQITDLAGNTSLWTQSTNFEIDSTAPTITITSPANNSYAKNSAVLSGACESGLNITFSGDITESFSIACSGGTYSQTVNFLNPGVDEPKNITVSQTDLAGNTASSSVTIINDNLPPVITRTSGASPRLTNTNSVTWGGTCEGTYTISVTGDTTTNFPCSSGSWTWTTPTITVDGTYNFSLSQTDGAGNVSTPLPLQWTRDQTPPTFNHQRTSPETNNKSSLAFSGECEGINAITISGAFSETISCSSGSWNWTTPTVSTDTTRNFTFTQSDEAGNQTVINHSWTRDTSGPQILVDLDKELIKANTNSVTITGTCDMTIADTTVTISGTDSTTTVCSSGTFSYTTLTQTTDATRVYNFAQTNGLGTTTTVSSTWIRETNLPTISSTDKDSTVNDPSKTNFILTDMTATSANAQVGIAEFCFLSNINTQPAASDDCWVKVNAPHVGLTVKQTLNLDNYSNLLGWQTIAYNVYAFVKDEAGNISVLTNGGAGTIGVDRYQITYDPGVPPVVSGVVAANTDVTANPPTLAENNVPAGNDVYIRWKVTDNNPLPAGAIKLNYTEDEINFVPITLTNPADPFNPAANFTGLDNANYGCPTITLGANEGCYKWTGGSPLSTSYKIQVAATDATDLTVKLISNPLNTGSIKLLAGNTESGLGGSAQAAMFYTRETTWEIDPKSLIVTESGDLYFADEKRGILTIDRSDAKQKIFVPTTGTSTGDGGVATSATLKFPTRLALDYQNRLLVLDGNRIRRIDLNQTPPTIETIIGGGSDTGDTVTDALQVNIYNHGNDWPQNKIPFFALPNGDIIFMSEYGRKDISDPDHRYRIYRAATKVVESRYFVKGSETWDTGDYYHTVIDTANPDPDLSNCRVNAPSFRFDPLTSQLTGMRAQVESYHSWVDCARNDGNTTDIYYSVTYFDPATGYVVPDLQNYDQFAGYAAHHMVTGMDGNLYQVVHDYYVNRINFDGTTTRVLGSGTRGVCIDGTPATSCNISIDDFFVSQSGKFYFSDGGVIRTVESDGTVTTLAGQRRTYGDGVNALDARLTNPLWIAQRNNGVITYGDGYFFKEFSIEGNVNVIAGNGNYDGLNDLGVDAKTVGMYDNNWWEQDPVSGNIYLRGEYRQMHMLNRSTGMYERVVGGGPNEYWNNDGQAGTSRNSSRHMLIIGIDDSGRVLTNNMKYNSTEGRYEDFMYKLYDPFNATPFLQTHVAGTNDPATTYQGGYYGMADGATTSTGKVSYYSYQGRVDWDSVDGKWIVIQRALPINNNYGKQVWYVTPGGTMNIAATLPRYVDYAYEHVRHSGKEWLYYVRGGRIYVHNLTDNIDNGALSWSMPTLNAQGYKMIYNSSSNSLIFPCNQNGLGCIAQYFLP